MSLRARALLTAVAALCCALPVLAGPLDPPLGIEEPAFGEAVTAPPAAAAETPGKAAFIVQYDDNEADLFTYGSPANKTFEMAMRFDDVGGPLVTLGGAYVCMKTSSGTYSKYRFELVVWAANGTGGSPGTELTRAAALASNVGTTLNCYFTSLNYALTAEDVYVGIRQHTAVDPNIRYGLDFDGASVHPGYYRYNETGSWNSLTGAFVSYNAIMIRASVFTPGVFLETLLLPFYSVDGSSPAGSTTLYALRNLTDSTVSALARYFTTTGTSQLDDDLSLAPYETKTVNLRDVAGLAADGDGFKRGFVLFSTGGDPFLTPVLAGDYFQVDVGNNFATGDKLVRGGEVCNHASIRFLDFPLAGSGTRLTVWIENPRGTEAGDPASYTVQAYNEAGTAVGPMLSFKTDAHATEYPDVNTLTTLDFGVLKFDFTNSFGGTVYAEAFADDRFAVGVTSQCEDAL